MSDLRVATAVVERRVRAYFAPVARATGTPVLWDPAGIASFNVDAPPAPWVDLGLCTGFTRHSGQKTAALLTGAPAMAAGQVRTELGAQVSCEFESWGKLQMALTAGAQQMNVLAGTAASVVEGSTVTTVILNAAATGFPVGSLVVVDVDYAGTTGFVGSGVSGGYVKLPASVSNDVNYVRRVSLNVARVTGSSGNTLTLGGVGLPAGAPVDGMKVSAVAGFYDREGGSFFQEWSALFVVDGAQGDRVVYHYPRLQATDGARESGSAIGGGLNRLRLAGTFRALPVIDAVDGERVVCFRSYLPAAMRAV